MIQALYTACVFILGDVTWDILKWRRRRLIAADKQATLDVQFFQSMKEV